MSTQLSTLNSQPSTSLSAMSIPELTQMAKMLDTYQEKIESMSGIAATMRGLVLLQIKQKLEHGQFGPWLKKHFKKTQKTANEDMRISRGFVKFNPRLNFESLAKSLAEKAREPEIDLENPIVKTVAHWVSGRPRVQLLLEFPSERGGKRDVSSSKQKHNGAADSPAQAALDIWDPIIKKLISEGLEEKSWKDLTRKNLDRLGEALTDLKKAMKGTS